MAKIWGASVHAGRVKLHKLYDHSMGEPGKGLDFKSKFQLILTICWHLSYHFIFLLIQKSVNKSLFYWQSVCKLVNVFVYPILALDALPFKTWPYY